VGFGAKDAEGDPQPQMFKLGHADEILHARTFFGSSGERDARS